MPRAVSIIVLTRNCSELVPRCLQAIAAQTFPDFEVILVDDGSTEEHRAANRAVVESLGPRFIYDTAFGAGHPETGLPHVLWALEKERILEREESNECPRSVARIRPSSSGKP